MGNRLITISDCPPVLLATWYNRSTTAKESFAFDKKKWRWSPFLIYYWGRNNVKWVLYSFYQTTLSKPIMRWQPKRPIILITESLFYHSSSPDCKYLYKKCSENFELWKTLFKKMGYVSNAIRFSFFSKKK
jgi:hypothetical protein